jgi:hypothetical protein
MKPNKERIKEIESDIKDVLIEMFAYSDTTEFEDVVMVEGINYWVKAYLTTREEVRYNDHGNDSFEAGEYKDMTQDDVELIKLEIENIENEDFDVIY